MSELKHMQPCMAASGFERCTCNAGSGCVATDGGRTCGGQRCMPCWLAGDPHRALNDAVAGALVLCESAVEKYGHDRQVDMAIEECGELIVALALNRRGRGTSADVMIEAADVIIVALQVALMFDGTAELTRHMRAKLDRLAERLKR